MKPNKGFSLIELLITISLIGILMSVLMITIDPVAQIKKGRDANRKSDLRQIQSALELYRSDQGQYPAVLYGTACPTSAAFSAPSPGTAVYMRKVPCDPYDKANYTYAASGCPTCNTYVIYACLENTKDIDRDADDGTASDLCPNTVRVGVSYTLRNP